MLIVVRGNSGSGKSTLAAALQQELGWPTAILGQDHFRRIVYKERQDAGHPDGMAHAALLEAAARHCIAAGQHLILEGIFQSDRYGAMIARIAADSADARFYAFTLSFEETMLRHTDRALASEFTAEQMKEWFRGWDPLPFVDERPILPAEELNTVVRRIMGNR